MSYTDGRSPGGRVGSHSVTALDRKMEYRWRDIKNSEEICRINEYFEKNSEHDELVQDNNGDGIMAKLNELQNRYGVNTYHKDDIKKQPINVSGQNRISDVQTAYAVLEIEKRPEDQCQLMKISRELSKRYNPNNGTSPDEEKFKAITEAYNFLLADLRRNRKR